MEDVQGTMIAWIRSEVCGTEVPVAVKSVTTAETLPLIYKLAKQHDVAHLVAAALYREKMIEENTETGRLFAYQHQIAVYRYEQMQYEAERVYAAFEEACIPYMPLKGAVLRAYYPEPWMRTSCDTDIFVREEHLNAAVAVLEEKLGYTNGGPYVNDISFYSENGIHFELHYGLVNENLYPESAEILSRIWEDATVENGYRYVASREMFYYYHIAHMAKHFNGGGCGMRPFIDLWIMEHKMPPDKAKVDELLAQGKLLTFANAARGLANAWLTGTEASALEKDMAEYVLFGGVYGTMSNRVVVEQSKKKGRFKYVWSRIFAPYEELKRTYPKLEGHKWKLPFYQLRRWANLITKKGKAKDSIRELKITKRCDKNDKIAKMMKELEL